MQSGFITIGMEALFHDLPEVLTRDIISPVKRPSVIWKLSSRGRIRPNQQKLKPLLKEDWYDEILYFTMNEFETKILDERRNIRHLENDIIPNQYNFDQYSLLMKSS